MSMVLSFGLSFFDTTTIDGGTILVKSYATESMEIA